VVEAPLVEIPWVVQILAVSWQEDLHIPLAMAEAEPVDQKAAVVRVDVYFDVTEAVVA